MMEFDAKIANVKLNQAQITGCDWLSATTTSNVNICQTELKYLF